jgi:putative tricarboxylic transport membrane protein
MVLLRRLKTDGETILSIFLFILGSAYFSLTFTFEEYGGFGGYNVSAKRMPQILGLALCICAACNIRFSIVRARSKTEEARYAPEAVRGDILRGVLTFVLMVAYIALLELVGFLIMSALYVFFQILLFSKKEHRNYPVSAVAAVSSSAAIYYVFLYGFKMILPVGLLA